MRYKTQPLTEKAAENRRRIRKVYGTEEGMAELFNLFHDFGLFRVISAEELDSRNRMIKKAEEIGMLDENIVRDMISYYFSLPLVEIEKKFIKDPEKEVL